jgi:hypothetical protein
VAEQQVWIIRARRSFWKGKRNAHDHSRYLTSSVSLGFLKCLGGLRLPPPDSNVCAYAVDTGSTSPVDLGGGGHTADRREWVIAPGDKYLVNPSVTPRGFTGRNVACEIGASEGVQQRKVTVGTGAISVTFAKKYLVVAHAETG